jgi:hypothetical protein
MKDRTQANTTNDKSNRQAEALIDLPVTDDQADETKGGASGTGKTLAAEVIASRLLLDQ